MLSGIDISNYQRNNYKYLINTYAKDFVICRACWRYSVDPMCDVMIQYAKSQKKKLGVYFFPLTSDGSPEEHAEWSYKQVLGYINEAIFILDWESYQGSEGRNNVDDLSWALRWMKKFHELSGVKPLIYMNSYCNATYNFSEFVKNDFGLWIANYGANNGKDNGRPKVKWWTNAAIHQFTSLGDNGKSLDRDTFYGDQKAWDLYAKSNKAQTPDKPAPELPPKTYTQEEVDAIILSATNGYQERIDQIELELRNSQENLSICESVVDNAKKGINGILNYEKK